MAHIQQLQFVQMAAQHLAADFSHKRVLEIGSYDVNGSIRSIFLGSAYVGVDIIPGPGVDIVREGDKFADPDETYDLTLSCECFEHNPQWLETFLNMYRMTKAGGVIMFTCATTGRLEHGTTRTLPASSPGNITVGWDYYRNLKERDFTSRLEFSQMFTEYVFVRNRWHQDLYFIGSKQGGRNIFRLNSKALVSDYYAEAKKTQMHLNANSPYPLIFRLMSKMILSPLRIAKFLPDKQYQNVALTYIRAFNAIRRPLQRPFDRLNGNDES